MTVGGSFDKWRQIGWGVLGVAVVLVSFIVVIMLLGTMFENYSLDKLSGN